MHLPLIGKQSQVSEFEATLAYIVSPRPSRVIQCNPASKKKCRLYCSRYHKSLSAVLITVVALYYY